VSSDRKVGIADERNVVTQTRRWQVVSTQNILAAVAQIFSAVPTGRRRRRDSNLRYNSETGKCRRLRKMQGINNLVRELTNAWVP